MDDELSEYYFESNLPEIHPGVLFPIPLLGIGTGSVESLFGYLTRLALAHRVPLSDLIVQVIRPELGKRGGGHWVVPASKTKCRADILGAGPEADLWVNTLSKLTGIRDLEHGTLHWIRSCISDEGLLSGVPKYCQVCMLESLVSGTSDHDPLLMNLEAIYACPKHHVQLNFKLCSAPREDYLPPRQRVNHPGVCGACGKIGYTCNSQLPERASIEEIRRAVEIEKLVMFGAAGGIADRELLLRGLRWLLTEDIDIRSSRLELISPHGQFQITEFMRGAIERVALKTLLDICLANQTSPLSVLTGKPTPLRSSSNRACPVPYRGSVLPEVAEKEVRALLNDLNKPISVPAIERRLGLNRGILRAICPELEKEVRMAYSDAWHRNRMSKQAVMARECSEVIRVLRLKRQELTLPNAAIITNEAWDSKTPKSRMFLRMSASRRMDE